MHCLRLLVAMRCSHNDFLRQSQVMPRLLPPALKSAPGERGPLCTVAAHAGVSLGGGGRDVFERPGSVDSETAAAREHVLMAKEEVVR